MTQQPSIPDYEAEARKADQAYQAYLDQIALNTVASVYALRGGAGVGVLSPRPVLKIVAAARKRIRKATHTWWVYTRTLRTGYAVKDPSSKKVPTIPSLREDFARAIDDPKIRRTVTKPTAPLPRRHPINSRSWSDPIPQERISLPAQKDDQADREFLKKIELLEKHRAEQEKKIDLEKPAKEVDEIRERLKRTSDIRKTAEALKETLDSGRNNVVELSRKDKRAIGWARYSKTGTPCGFCAMLISRGVVYSSKATAGGQWHPNCQCSARPVYSQQQYDTDPAFDLNRYYSEWWPKVTKGLGGVSALNAWRRWVVAQKKNAESEDSLIKQVAQEAA